MLRLAHAQHVDFARRRHVIRGQRQSLGVDNCLKQQTRDFRKQQIPAPPVVASDYEQPCNCGLASVMITDRRYCSLCWWLRGVGSHWQAAARNVAERGAVAFAPMHEQKPAYYQWRHYSKSKMSKAEWQTLQLTDCSLCGSRSWHNQWNRPELRDGSWTNLCKCCAIMSEPFSSLAQFQEHCKNV